MKPRRAVISPEQFDAVVGGSSLPRDAAHYFVDVLRLRVGDEVELADGAGRLVVGDLSRSTNQWRLKRCQLTETDAAHALPITLLVGLIKQKRWRMVVEKSVELGVGVLVPLITQHVDWRPAPKEFNQLTTRWERIALEASRQCRRAVATRITAPVSLDDALAQITAPNRLMAHTDAQDAWRADELAPLAPTAILVGPEGGFSTTEIEAAQKSRFLPITLGSYTLRTETAANALVAIVRDRLGFAMSERGEPPCR